LSSPLESCKALWGPASAQNFQNADDWHVIVLIANGADIKGYIDGYHASSVAPLKATPLAAATIAQMRLGLMDQVLASTKVQILTQKLVHKYKN